MSRDIHACWCACGDMMASIAPSNETSATHFPPPFNTLCRSSRNSLSSNKENRHRRKTTEMNRLRLGFALAIAGSHACTQARSKTEFSLPPLWLLERSLISPIEFKLSIYRARTSCHPSRGPCASITYPFGFN